MFLSKTLNISTKEESTVQFTDDQISEQNERIKEDKIIGIREKRNSLLAQSDWTQVADAPIDKTAWATYRQALRDVPSQAGFPNTITWPSEPE